MSVMILEADPFIATSNSLGSSACLQNNVRRPLFGISVKQNRFGFLSMWQVTTSGESKAISLADSSAPGGHSQANHNFCLQTVTEQRQERAQIIETFGDHFVFFYGGKPIILQCAGLLINTRDFNWKNEWLYNYENFLRGTKCVEYRARIYLGFDDVLVEGYILNTNVSTNAQEMPYLCPFNFTLLVSRYTDLSQSVNDVVASGDGTNVYTGSGLGARRTLIGGRVVEYMTELIAAPYMVIDPATGDVVHSKADFGTPPETIIDGKTARASVTTDDSLTSITKGLDAQIGSSAYSWPSDEKDARDATTASLSSGVANSCALIGT